MKNRLEVNGLFWSSFIAQIENKIIMLFWRQISLNVIGGKKALHKTFKYKVLDLKSLIFPLFCFSAFKNPFMNNICPSFLSCGG